MGVVKHGMYGTTEYITWRNIKQRCYNKNKQHYQHYGGRGIKVCDRWIDSFENFYRDMGDRPSPRHSIDRINTNGDYSPENCRWATPEQQAATKNLSKRSKSGVSGVIFVQSRGKWIVTHGKTYLGWTDDFFEACCIRKSFDNKRREELFCNLF